MLILRDRFGIVAKLDYYKDEEIIQIILMICLFGIQ